MLNKYKVLSFFKFFLFNLPSNCHDCYCFSRLGNFLSVTISTNICCSTFQNTKTSVFIAWVYRSNLQNSHKLCMRACNLWITWPSQEGLELNLSNTIYFNMKWWLPPLVMYKLKMSWFYCSYISPQGAFIVCRNFTFVL